MLPLPRGLPVEEGQLGQAEQEVRVAPGRDHGAMQLGERSFGTLSERVEQAELEEDVAGRQARLARGDGAAREFPRGRPSRSTPVAWTGPAQAARVRPRPTRSHRRGWARSIPFTPALLPSLRSRADRLVANQLLVRALATPSCAGPSLLVTIGEVITGGSHVIPAAAGLVTLVCTFGGVLVGVVIRRIVPREQVSGDEQTIKLGLALVATMTALVLGLVTASAKSSFDARGLRGQADRGEIAVPRPGPCPVRPRDSTHS